MSRGANLNQQSVDEEEERKAAAAWDTQTIASFVQASGGTRVIEKVTWLWRRLVVLESSGLTFTCLQILIANNGIAAVKCMRSIRRWCYNTFQDERAVKFVAMVR